MRRNVRRYLRRHFRRRKPRPAPQSWLRRYRLHILVVAVLCYVFVYCGFRGPFSQINPMQGRYDAIDHGMTVEQVEGMLGKPNFSDTADGKIWSSRGGVIVVDFESGRVSHKEFMPIQQRYSFPRGQNP
jgi:hypothetical protein